MGDVLRSLMTYFAENWPEILWVVLAAGSASYLAGWTARSRWKKRDFLDRLNVSLSSCSTGVLKIRTLIEVPCVEVFLNEMAAKEIRQLAKQTTPENSLIPIPKKDSWFYLNAVLNEISQRYSDGFVKRDMGKEVSTEEYLICLTCEKAGAVRTQKIRALVVQKSLLTKLPEEMPKLESPNHSTRWDTLKQLAESYQKEPWRFLTMEICQ